MLQLNRSLDFEAVNLETLRSKKNSRADRLSTVAAISNKISGLLSDDRKLLGVKDKLSYLDYAFERFREVITTMSSKFGIRMPSLNAKLISVSCAVTPVSASASKVSKRSSRAGSRDYGRASSVASERAGNAARVAELKAKIALLHKR